MVDDFHHRRKVTLLLKLSRVYPDQGKKLIGIDQVEITGQGKVPGRDGIPFYKRMAEFSIIPSLGAVAQVPQQSLSQKIDVPLHQPGMFSDIGLVLLQLLHLSQDLGKNIRNGLIVTASDPIQEGVPRLRIQLYSSYSCPVLPPVVLLFHQQVELVQAIQNGPVLLQIIEKRLTKSIESPPPSIFISIPHDK